MAVVRARNVESFRPAALRHSALWESTLDSLRLAILRGELPPGAQLVEVDLAARLGVSRGPVREALRRLELEGLVENQPRRGAFVVGMTERDVHEIYSLRIVLETFAIELAALQGTREGVEQLRHHIEQMREGLGHKRSHAVAEHDMAFHRQLIDMAAHRRLLAVWTLVAAPVHALLSVADTVYTDMPTAVDQHELLVGAIERRDPRDASSLLRQHLLSGERIVLHVVQGAEGRDPGVARLVP